MASDTIHTDIDPVWNEETLRTIREAREGVNLHGPYHSVEELMEDLQACQKDMKEYRANSVTYTHEEVGKILGLK